MRSGKHRCRQVRGYIAAGAAGLTDGSHRRTASAAAAGGHGENAAALIALLESGTFVIGQGRSVRFHNPPI